MVWLLGGNLTNWLNRLLLLWLVPGLWLDWSDGLCNTHGCHVTLMSLASPHHHLLLLVLRPSSPPCRWWEVRVHGWLACGLSWKAVSGRVLTWHLLLQNLLLLLLFLCCCICREREGERELDEQEFVLVRYNVDGGVCEDIKNC